MLALKFSVLIWRKKNKKWTPNLRIYTYISSKYLTNMLKGIIIQKNIHLTVRVSRCTTAKLFPISVSYLSRPICPLCLFWINFAYNNRHHFLNENDAAQHHELHGPLYNQYTQSIQTRISYFLLLSFYIIQRIIGAWSFYDIFFRSVIILWYPIKILWKYS